MKTRMKKLPIGLAAAALALTATLSVGSAMGYFTTYCTAQGGAVMNMGFTTTIPDEEVDSKGKHVTIRNTGDYECYVRVKAFASVDLGYEPGENWSYSETDGYWHYDAILAPGGETTELLITYTLPAAEDAGDGTDIIVVQECTPVLYDEDGTAYADWFRVVTENPEDGNE